jgi:hypothetical protein
MKLGPRRQHIALATGIFFRRSKVSRDSNFDRDYPNAAVGFTCGLGFTKASETATTCAVCRRPTRWVFQRLGIFVCSAKCCETYRSEGSHFAVSP